MIDLISLEVHHFFSFGQAKIDLSKPGLYLITGQDVKGGDSNGSGKSTILNAICWALFGRTLKGVQGKDVVMWGHNNCKVILHLKQGGMLYEIERTLDSLIFKMDGTPVVGNRTDIQTTIGSVFKTEFYSFSRSAAFAQGQVEFLAASGDADKKKLFKDLLGLSRLDGFYDKIRLRYNTTNERADRVSCDVGFLQSDVDSLNAKLDAGRDQKDLWDSQRISKIANLEAMKEARKPMPYKDLERSINTWKTQLKAYALVPQDLETIEADQDHVDTGIVLNNQEIKRLWSVIEKGQKIGQRCDVCGSIVNNKMLSAHRRELEDSIAGLTANNKDRLTIKKTLQDQIELLQDKCKEMEDLKNSIRDAEFKLTGLKLETMRYEDLCGNIDRQILEVQNDNPYDRILSALVAECEYKRSSLVAKEAEFETLKRDLDVLAFLKWVLSREGVASFIIEKSFSRLEHLTNLFLSRLSKGNIQVTITPQKELKSGELKEQIDIRVQVDGNNTNFWGLSDGQRQRLNIAMLLSLHKMCREYGVNNFNFLLLDEVLDISLDNSGQMDVVEMLDDYRQECKVIMVISHKDAIKDNFQYRINVNRDEEGVSTCT